MKVLQKWQKVSSSQVDASLPSLPPLCPQAQFPNGGTQTTNGCIYTQHLALPEGNFSWANMPNLANCQVG